ncbi:uncharacterized protein LOC120013139 isoform X2 [Tripterygium wilfordii]|uniref:uncharacterized protein LOC120013139 isoform X2 n=1 Tax=Tripterygium wilfordii TaxID=458696 RepID=UPI0018F84331|nr:uncharacterized protein LOC120013139 isoform X2 [Tripterygium wilfordii]
MDSFISSALDEICSRGSRGLPIASLWPALAVPVTPSLKASVWRNLLVIPALQLKAPNGRFYQHGDASIQAVEDAERLDVMIIAKEELRDNFVGLYDSITSINVQQRRTLERLAVARTHGITQSQLGKEFGIQGKDLFYIVRNLECRELIVRQPAVVKTKEACGEGDIVKSPSVTTNLMHLYRYARHLGSQQRIEIHKEGRNLDSLGNAEESDVFGDDFNGDSIKEDVLVKDYIPAMKAVCEKLDEASDKVLVVSDIKQDLGYTGAHFAHRAWRNICRRLKDAGIVEEFEAKVNKKVERCLRLLKKLSPKNFEPEAPGFVNEQPVKFGRRSQKSDQLVDLPIEYQIYDMVDAAGSDGLTVVEVCERLGIDKKRNYPRFHNIISRFGMHLQPENHKRQFAYRLWTSKNCDSEASNALSINSKIVSSRNKSVDSDVNNLDVLHRPTQKFLEYGHSASEADFAPPQKVNDKEVVTEFENGIAKTNPVPISPDNQLYDPNSIAPDAEVYLSNTVMETNHAISEDMPLPLSEPFDSRSCQNLQYVRLTADGALREQRILERLQAEKFLLRGELYRWLVSLEKDKSTTTDRKTIDRILNKLQQLGRCKCIHVNVPNVTNCGRNRMTQVVLHPSVQGLPPELIGEIHDRIRSFEKKIRGLGSNRCKISNTIPVLDGIQRTQIRAPSDAKAIESESRRANGFVSAKMVRSKLLHSFLWSYVTSSLDLHDALSVGDYMNGMNNSHRSCNLFSLEAAIKAIPFELFLQVAGSSQKYDDMIEMCSRKLSLSDLPIKEYKLLMDTHATGRLSMLIDILRRLKLIRLITNGCANVGGKVPHASFTHALELKPYIEEPPSTVATSNMRSFDLRPRIRHDFFLSNREAVDEYWHTLEYCYATANPQTALHAFPGSAAHEVFLGRSWASVRVMTADQRAQLLKLVLKDGLKKKLPFNECENIAKDLNLTLQQVLRVYYDQRHRRVNLYQGLQDVNGVEYQTQKGRCTSSKRKKSSEASSRKFARIDAGTVQLGEERLARQADAFDPFSEEQNSYLAVSGEDDIHVPAYFEESGPKTSEGPGTHEVDQCYALMSQCAFPNMRQTRGRRFSWTDEADRQLVIQYVKQRAALGAKIHRIDWALLPGLPAPPRTCARRMSSLKTNRKFRKAIMKLCNILGQRYAKHLEQNQNRLLDNDGCRVFLRCSSGEVRDRESSNHVGHTDDIGFGEERWVDFEDKEIKRTLEDALRYKPVGKIEPSKLAGSVPEELSDLDMNAEDYGCEMTSSAVCSDGILNLDRNCRRDSGRRLKHHQLHHKFIKLLSRGTSVSGQVNGSLAVSNAVELFKLVFLSTATSPKLQYLLAETLRRYSEHDLFAAFSYLRDKKIMIGGGDAQPFELSQQFLHGLSKSPFPANTGKRATMFLGQLLERQKDLIEVGVNLNSDFQCGDIFQLFALVFSGELSVSPCMPDEGFGETEDRCLKRKIEDGEFHDSDKAKKMKSLTEGELISRREKGFPGIMVCMRRVTISMANTLEIFKEDDNTFARELSFNDNVSFNEKNVNHSEHTKGILNFDRTFPVVGHISEPDWEAMTGYAEYFLPKTCSEEQIGLFSSDVFKAVCAAIQKSGDQGLSMEEVSQVVSLQGEETVKLIIDVLEAFGQALKVNAYDSVRIVDSLYRSKFFLTSMAGFCYDRSPASLAKSLERGQDGNIIPQPEDHDFSSSMPQKDVSMNVDKHKITILNLPEELALQSSGIKSTNGHEDHTQGVGSFKVNTGGETYKFLSGEINMPIIPWINGDGTINRVVYNGLVRRVIGIVMQNPGILEDDIIHRMDVLNPQSCRKLLELMILDKHLIVKKIYQTAPIAPPALLGSLFASSSREPEPRLVCRSHVFANPMSANLL